MKLSHFQKRQKQTRHLARERIIRDGPVEEYVEHNLLEKVRALTWL